MTLLHQIPKLFWMENFSKFAFLENDLLVQEFLENDLLHQDCLENDFFGPELAITYLSIIKHWITIFG